MSSLNSLNQGTWTTASQIPFGDAASGQTRRGAVEDLIALIQGEITTQGNKVTQYAAPLTGATVTVSPVVDGGWVFLRLQPVGTLAALTIALPAEPLDGQEIQVKSTQIVTALAFSPGSGDTLSGAPTTLAANGYFTLRFDAVNSAWDRVA